MARKKVMVGMSGGVDSSVAAALLKEQGYEVIGITMQIWPDAETAAHEGGCCSLSAVEDARRVAYTLDIPYYVLNFKDVFEDKVIRYFTCEYLQGRTPNPCIACNRHVKFDALLNKALSMDIDYIATGHYAIIEYSNEAERYLLKKSVTARKDQTYALYTLTQSQLARTLMPVGHYTKEQIRQKAGELGLQVAAKPDSQEICFVTDDDYAGFIGRYTGKDARPGNFLDREGNILGRHKGLIHYTIGQRKGLGIALGKPVFVSGLDVKNNAVILGEEREVFHSALLARDINLISMDTLGGPIRVKSKIRYSAREADSTLFPQIDGSIRVEFDQPQRAITPGQSVVFYDGDVVVGGGIIEGVCP